MHPEIKQQLYGGDISDYYQKTDIKNTEQENKEIADLYKNISNRRFFVREDVEMPPPAIVQKAEDTKLTFDDIFNFIKEHEGLKHRTYKDTRGIPTVGIGFNLTRPDAKKIVQQAGANYEKVLVGAESLTNSQIKEIFILSLNIAYHDAKKWIPGFDGLPKNIKLAVLDLSFNMGYSRLSKFIKTKEAIIVGDYTKAAEELRNSKWAYQVGKRAKNIINLFSS